MTKLFLFH